MHKHVGAHRNIIEFYDNGEDDAWVWIAMELAEGGDLFDKIEADLGVSEDIAHAYFTQLINAVGYMHSKGVGHRDIKPENVLLSADGNLKLADFGMATLFEYHGKRKMAVTTCGSPPYVAPEVLTPVMVKGTKTISYCADQADIWSCGVVLFVLLAGNTPWSSPVRGNDEYGRPNDFYAFELANGRPDDDLWNGLPMAVCSLLRGMLRIDLESRFSLEEVRRHPWFTRSNKYIGDAGQLIDQISMATNMFEALHVSFDADPFAGMQTSQKSDSMDVDRVDLSKSALSSTQPHIPIEDMLFDWERPKRLMISATQPQILDSLALPATQPSSLWEEPAMSQFTARPAVPMSRTQMARKFRDILPAQSLTRFFSVWAWKLLVPILVETLSRLGVPTLPIPEPISSTVESVIKVDLPDTRGCRMTGKVCVVYGLDGLAEVDFRKTSGDPLQWRRFFKNMVVLCKDAVYRPEE